ncbi:MAG: dienelactone hydrolase family protein [Bacteroidales bacterium]|jgi:carboxymethylenebutenolidase|nr:dienelactone hydrolase family protein [Bacteroidales bacterium]
MNRKINRLVTDYRQGGINRRDFMKRLVLYAGGTAAAFALLEASGESAVAAELMQDTGIVAEFITYPVEGGTMKGLLAHPTEKKKYPAVIVIHENRGLVPHIQSVNRRMAMEGFLALAPDGNSPLGGTPEDDTKGMELLRQIPSETHTKNFVAAVKYLQTHPLSNGKVGCTGFCWGGAVTNQVAVNAPELKASVPYYGRVPATEDVPKIKAAVMAHYAENDAGINAGIEGFREAMKNAGIEHQIFTYPGTGHAFNNDTNPGRYNEEAAKLAWGRTVAFFKEKLK